MATIRPEPTEGGPTKIIRTGGSEFDPTPHQPPDERSRRIAEARKASRKENQPEPPVHGKYGGWDR